MKWLRKLQIKFKNFIVYIKNLNKRGTDDTVEMYTVFDDEETEPPTLVILPEDAPTTRVKIDNK